jgi:hypothetical protein
VVEVISMSKILRSVRKKKQDFGKIFGELQPFGSKQRKKKIKKGDWKTKQARRKTCSYEFRGSKNGVHSFLRLYYVLCHHSYSYDIRNQTKQLKVE